jgi:hypothetical protein
MISMKTLINFVIACAARLVSPLHAQRGNPGSLAGMDCRVAALLAMNSPVIVKVAVIANAVKQSMTSEGMDRHGLRPRDDANNTVIARNVVTWQSVCGIRPDTGGSH